MPGPWRRFLAVTTFVDEAAISGKVGEVRGSAQQQRALQNCCLDMAVGALDRTVLVGNACVVARRLHTIMGA